MTPLPLSPAADAVRRILIIHNEPSRSTSDPDGRSELEVLDTVAAVEASLTRTGREVARLAVGEHFDRLAGQLANCQFDVVFNLFEGLADRPQTEVTVAAMLERAGVPFTGCPARALRAAGAKHIAKRLLQRAGFSTPAFRVVWRKPPRAAGLRWPLIVKPALFDASLGIDQSSVVTNGADLDRQVERIMARFGPPVLVEEFIDGREFAVTLVQCERLHCLPIREIAFDDSQQRWPILSYDGKWDPSSPGYLATPVLYPAAIDTDLAERLLWLSREAYGLLSCRDFGRVELRINRQGEPLILEVNPNPDLLPTAFLSFSIAAGHIDFDALVLQLVANAWSRRSPPASDAAARRPPALVKSRR